jgi:hypothetical protein
MTLGNMHEDGMRTEDPETGEPFEGNEIGWIDPRACNQDGEVLSPRGLPSGGRHARMAEMVAPRGASLVDAAGQYVGQTFTLC